MDFYERVTVELIDSTGTLDQLLMDHTSPMWSIRKGFKLAASLGVVGDTSKYTPCPLLGMLKLGSLS